MTSSYTPAQLSKLLNVSKETLRKWNNDGKITSVDTQGGHRRYIFQHVEPNQQKSFVYARVSSFKQAGDLERQVAHLQAQFPSHEVITDIGSGLNFKRKGLLKILELLFLRRVQEVVVAHKDRLCRFGFDLFQFIFKQHGAVLKVLDTDGIKQPIDEFAEDVMSVITVFTARYYGSRKYNLLQKDQDISIPRATRVVPKVSRRKQVLLQSRQRIRKGKATS